MACSYPNRTTTDRLNEISYAFHYKDIDSTESYANKALKLAGSYSSGKAEALNNLAFTNIAKMNYKLASRQLDSISSITDNQIELLIADIQNMRLCQRRAKNKDFYEFKESAAKRIQRIRGEENTLSEHLKQRFLYAETEYSFVTSTYYYYVGHTRQSISALSEINKDGLLQKDTAQYLNWLYQTGSGGMIVSDSRKTVVQKEYDMLLECYLIAKKHGYIYWEANALQALSEHFFDKSTRDYIIEHNPVSIGYVNADNMPENLIAGYLAQKSTDMFARYGDIYQMAGSLRTLAKCYWGIGDNQTALHWLNHTLELGGGKITQAPDLIASIREQLSIVYSSIGDKHNSDLNRNIYLDMQEKTRQDMELDARATQLERTSNTLNILILIIVGIISTLAFLIIILVRSGKKHVGSTDEVAKAFDKFSKKNAQLIKNLQEKIEDMEERCNIAEFDYVRNKRRYMENKAKVFLVESIKPLISRMAVEIYKICSRQESELTRKERLQYIIELSEKIDEYNDVLTKWITLRQGDIAFKIESFHLSDIFDIIRQGRTVFSMQGIKLDIKPTDFTIKADKILTLFMVNTIADNARKFTPRGGNVKIYAEEEDLYIRISITDNGKGMSSEELNGVFKHSIDKGHGFGLQNCRGILEKYKKYSRLFEKCEISATSRPGKGSTFSFTLPKGVTHAITTLLIIGASITSFASQTGKITSRQQHRPVEICLAKASAFADSAYFSNINGTYEKTLAYADSSRHYLNQHYLSCYPNGRCLMERETTTGSTPAEIQWLHSGLDTDFSVILDIRNESAVAALALHKWNTYYYNNTVYTKLFKELSSDSSLGEYCRIMQKSETNKNIAIVLLILLILVLFALSYIIYYRHAIRRHSIGELLDTIKDILSAETKTTDKIKQLMELRNNPYYKEIEKQYSRTEEILRKAQDKEETLMKNIQILEEKARVTEHEKACLYVSNNILENCLSAIKHETMYYPAQIKRHTEEFRNEGKYNITELKDIVEYYENIYAALCRQMHRQVERFRLPCTKVDISQRVGENGIMIYGDSDITEMLFDTLKKQNEGKVPKYTVHLRNSTYVSISAEMSSVKYYSDSMEQPFSVSAHNLPYLICRQITRETAESTNRCGCGMTAEEHDGKLIVIITLPLATGTH